MFESSLNCLGCFILVSVKHYNRNCGAVDALGSFLAESIVPRLMAELVDHLPEA